MIQTDSAAALLPAAAMDKTSGKGGKAADDSGAFSQEFEKQVNKSSEPVKEAGQQRAAAAQEKKTEATPDKPEKQDAADAGKAAEARTGDTDARHGKTAEKQPDETESGKKLPPELAVADESTVVAELDSKKGEPVDAVVADSDSDEQSAEPVAAQLASQVDRKDKAVADLLKSRKEQTSEDEQPLAVPFAAVQAPVSDMASADEAAASADADALVTDVRVRDLLAQRMMGGTNQENGAFAGKQAKTDITALAAMQAGQGRASQGGFDDLMKMSSATVMSSTPQASPVAAQQPSAATVPVAMTLALPMQQQGWDKAMAERVVWMARGNIQHAQLQLNPRDLGPIDIKITMQHDQTHVNFVAHHVATRDAIEAAIPRLRDMMNEQGLNLGQADVSHHSFGDSGRQAAAANGGHGQSHGGGAGMEEELAEDTLMPRNIGHVSASGVDYFA